MLNGKIPGKLREIIEDFQFAEGREKLELLLDYAERLPPLPEHLQGNHNLMDQVEECMTPVFVDAELREGKIYFHFEVPRESPTVRGYAALMQEGLDGASPEEVLQVPAEFYLEMGLHEVLTQQRLNGISAILAHMKRMAVKAEA